MPPILTAEDVVKRIAAECAFADDRGAAGIRLKPAAAILPAKLFDRYYRAASLIGSPAGAVIRIVRVPHSG